jgi:hypothetical protein
MANILDSCGAWAACRIMLDLLSRASSDGDREALSIELIPVCLTIAARGRHCVYSEHRRELPAWRADQIVFAYWHDPSDEFGETLSEVREEYSRQILVSPPNRGESLQELLQTCLGSNAPLVLSIERLAGVCAYLGSRSLAWPGRKQLQRILLASRKKIAVATHFSETHAPDSQASRHEEERGSEREPAMQEPHDTPPAEELRTALSAIIAREPIRVRIRGKSVSALVREILNQAERTSRPIDVADRLVNATLSLVQEQSRRLQERSRFRPFAPIAPDRRWAQYLIGDSTLIVTTDAIESYELDTLAQGADSWNSELWLLVPAKECRRFDEIIARRAVLHSRRIVVTSIDVFIAQSVSFLAGGQRIVVK